MNGPMLELFRSESIEYLGRAQALLEGNIAQNSGELGQCLGQVRAAALLCGLENIKKSVASWIAALEGVKSDSRALALDELKGCVELLLAACEDSACVLENIELDIISLHEPEDESGGADEKIAAQSEVLVHSDKTFASLAVNPMMLEMFHTEAQERIEALTTHIMALEDNPADAKSLESLMRAAHSIKGAARMIDLKPVSDLAHVLEDYFVAAQEGELEVNSEAADILLAAVDGLANLSFEREDDAGKYIQKLAGLRLGADGGDSADAAVAVESSAGDLKKAAVENAKEAKVESAQAADSVQVKTQQDTQVVRVAAHNISRIMGLAGETVVQSQGLEPLAHSLIDLKGRHLKIMESLDNLEQAYEENVQVAAEQFQQLRQQAAQCHNIVQQQIEEFDHLSRNSSDLSQRLYNEVLSSRMRPFSDGTRGFERMVRDLARELSKKVRFEIIGKDTKVDRDVLEKLEAPLTHLLRNAIDHGLQTPQEREEAGKPVENRLSLQALHWGGFLNVRVVDDGRGIDVERVRRKIVERGLHTSEQAQALDTQEVLEFLFLPGFSTSEEVSEISGRGVGLDVVRAMLHELGGQVTIDNHPGRGVCFNLRLAVTRSVARVLLVEICAEIFALPLNRIERLLKVARRQILWLEGKAYISDNGSNIALLEGNNIFGGGVSRVVGKQPVVVLTSKDQLFGLKVDRFLGEKEQVIKPLDKRLGKVQNISSAIILEDGNLALVIDVDDLTVNATIVSESASDTDATQKVQTGGKILVIDDSPTVREMEKRTLEAAGYSVQTAVDGVDGWVKVRADNYDLVVSDIDMPRMNGIELTRNLRGTPEAARLPIMLVSYKDREQDRRDGLAAGANYFMNKGGFNDDDFLRITAGLIAGEELA